MVGTGNSGAPTKRLLGVFSLSCRVLTTSALVLSSLPTCQLGLWFIVAWCQVPLLPCMYLRAAYYSVPPHGLTRSVCLRSEAEPPATHAFAASQPPLSPFPNP